MSLDDDLAKLAEQERQLQFDAFDMAKARELGQLLQQMAGARGLAVAIDVHLNGMQVFFCAFEGATADNASWIRRKRNLVLRLYKSSYWAGLWLKQIGLTLYEKLTLPDADYTPHGGCFPIMVKGTGCVGAVTVSGLPQRDDHNLVVEALVTLLGKDLASLKLADA
ncbi:heme-degrading domain-containing protein [Pararhizobium sp.]|uniref:heme-degrading domain-containing protein n=1 Tax=Pararhizobium sp. TaxID=1977563 RepID=UPI00271C3BA6|nr:heme-degrading domain-containing protein [Pararhizobium sp.]MDO9416497.1 heme-degrading domain-containing protein [Pararhizobium sp.]